MSNGINVKDILGVVEKKQSLFFRAVGPDKREAAKRLAETEKFFEEWHGVINQTNTRALPEDLVDLYDDVAAGLCRILSYEKDIVTKGGRR